MAMIAAIQNLKQHEREGGC